AAPHRDLGAHTVRPEAVDLMVFKRLRGGEAEIDGLARERAGHGGDLDGVALQVVPASIKRRRRPISTHGAAPMLRPLTTSRSPRLAPRSLCITKNQYMPCACAHTSLTPFHCGKAETAECADPATKSILPSRSASYVLSTGKMSSRSMSSPSSLKNPSSTAAASGKYEFEIMSGSAIFTARAVCRAGTNTPLHFELHRRPRRTRRV